MWVFHKAVPLQWQVDQSGWSGGQSKQAWKKRTNRKRREVPEHDSVCCELFRNWKWCSCRLPVAGLQPETHRWLPTNYFPFLFFSSPAFCLLRSFCTDIFAWLRNDLQFSEPLIYPPPHPSQPVSVASLFPSWRRPADLEHNSDPCGCFKHCVVVHFSHVSLKGVAASASFWKQNKICCNHELQLPPERPGSQTGSWLYIFPPDPFWHQHSKIRTADPIMQMN